MFRFCARPARQGIRSFVPALVLAVASLFPAVRVPAQETPYIVTYSHHLEEPGNLEIESFSTTGIPRSGQRAYTAPYLEFEYGVTGWWTSELYLEAQSTRGDSTIFTGWRLETRIRPLKREHRINPVLYFEYARTNEASRIQKEVAGHAEITDELNGELRREHEQELEAKLILSSTVHDWNISENFIVEKNLSEGEGFEFGYAVGISRPLSSMASGRECRLCRENFVAGLEMYGGLGSTESFGLRQTAHYLAPVVAWKISDNSTLHFSPSFGLTDVTTPVLLRFGYSYEIRGFKNKVAPLFRGGR
ncbi:MAG: hypothetical protein ACE14M_08345 [Terriglobales bacterium]